MILSPFTGPVEATRFARMLVHSVRNGFGTILSRKGLEAKIPDVEWTDQLGMMENVSRERIPFRKCDEDYVRVHGFFFPAKGYSAPKMRIRDKNGQSFDPRVVFREYPTSGDDSERVGRYPYVVFAVTSKMVDVSSCELSVSLGDDTVWRGPLAAAAGIKIPELEAEALVEGKHPVQSSVSTE